MYIVFGNVCRKTFLRKFVDINFKIRFFLLYYIGLFQYLISERLRIEEFPGYGKVSWKFNGTHMEIHAGIPWGKIKNSGIFTGYGKN